MAADCVLGWVAVGLLWLGLLALIVYIWSQTEPADVP